MASTLYIKSLVWLVALGGLGYGLLQVTHPSEAKLSEIRAFARTTTLTEEEKRKLLFMQKLKEAAANANENKPVNNQNETKDSK